MMAKIWYGCTRYKPSSLAKITWGISMAHTLTKSRIPTNPLGFKQITCLWALFQLPSKSPPSPLFACKSSTEIWNMLQEYYSQQSNANCAYYNTKLTNLKHGSHSISEYLQEANPSQMLMLLLVNLFLTRSSFKRFYVDLVLSTMCWSLQSSCNLSHQNFLFYRLISSCLKLGLLHPQRHFSCHPLVHSWPHRHLSPPIPLHSWLFRHCSL